AFRADQCREVHLAFQSFEFFVGDSGHSGSFLKTNGQVQTDSSQPKNLSPASYKVFLFLCLSFLFLRTLFHRTPRIMPPCIQAADLPTDHVPISASDWPKPGSEPGFRRSSWPNGSEPASKPSPTGNAKRSACAPMSSF